MRKEVCVFLNGLVVSSVFREKIIGGSLEGGLVGEGELDEKAWFVLLTEIAVGSI